MIWVQAPDWLAAAIYVAVGSLIVPSLPPLLEVLGTLPVVLLGLGEFLCIIGALIFALQRPNPSPEIFDYHGIFHLCVIAAAVLHFVVINYWVVLWARCLLAGRGLHFPPFESGRLQRADGKSADAAKRLE